MDGLVVSGTQVSYIGQDCREIPEHLGRDCGHFAKRLDLSFNLLRCCPPENNVILEWNQPSRGGRIDEDPKPHPRAQALSSFHALEFLSLSF
uniref:Uncharacterized protein n=1 Tax=Pipistrellus kuhlii TaxID=59472 RepID=A0A7J7VBQ1_PIPKU|nr:hypothetical protein mPipKuh1_010899 [Pipistrellus kuhlii]